MILTERLCLNCGIGSGVRRKESGAVLIFVLWVLSFLAVLAVHLAYGVRQKMTFVKRIESRSQIQHVVQGCAKMAVSLLLDDLQKNQYQYSANAKAYRHNNPSRFADITVPGGSCEISYPVFQGQTSQESRFGVVDEERKININAADKTALIRIIKEVLGLDDHRCEVMAEAVYDWRQMGDSEIKGFLSDDYYSNLKDPYPKKSLPFDLIDELLLVKGIDQKQFTELREYLTVYGSGQININTASRPVLLALGLTPEVADKLLAVRRGSDGIDDTTDDHVFYRTFDIASEVNAGQKLKTEEMQMIDALNQRNLLNVNSSFYSVQVKSFLDNSNETRKLFVVFSSSDNRIVYWNEK